MLLPRVRASKKLFREEIKMIGVESVCRTTRATIVGLGGACAALMALGIAGYSPGAVHAEEAKTPPPVTGSLITTSPDDPKLSWGACPDIFPKGCEVTVLSGDPAKGASDVYLRAPAGTNLQKLAYLCRTCRDCEGKVQRDLRGRAQGVSRSRRLHAYPGRDAALGPLRGTGGLCVLHWI